MGLVLRYMFVWGKLSGGWPAGLKSGGSPNE